MRVAEITQQPIELYKILKLEALTGSGGEAKAVITEGLVMVNGAVELQKRKKIMHGDIIQYNDESIKVQLNPACAP